MWCGQLGIHQEGKCPHCGKKREKNYPKYFGEEMNYPDLNLVKDEKTAGNLAFTLEYRIQHSHSLMVFISHYMVFVHYIMKFINDMEKGVMYNTRIKSADKLDYAMDYFSVMYGLGENIIKTIKSPLSCETRYVLKSVVTKVNDQGCPNFYYNKMIYDPSMSIELLTKLLLIHRKFEPIYVKFMEDIECNKKISTAKQWEWIEDETKKFIKLGLLK